MHAGPLTEVSTVLVRFGECNAPDAAIEGCTCHGIEALVCTECASTNALTPHKLCDLSYSADQERKNKRVVLPGALHCGGV